MADQDFDRGKIHKLASIRGEALASGLKLDQFQLQGIFWKDGSNVQFTANGVEKIQGWSAIFATTPTAPIRGMVDSIISGSQYLFYGDQSAIYRSVAGGAPTTVGSGYTGNLDATALVRASTWSMETFGTWVAATNGKDAPQIYKGTSFTALDVDSMFTTAEIFVKRGPHMLAFNLSTGSNEFRWCNAGDIETWLPAVGNSAGGLTIREVEGGIIAAVPLGDKIAVYGKDQAYLVSYVGAPFHFGYKPALDGVGAVSKASVVTVGRKNYGLGRHGFWVTDGVNFEYIDDPDIRDYVQDNLNWAQSSKVAAFHDEENKQVKWFIPTTTGEPDTYVAYDYKRSVWSKGPSSFTSAIPIEAFTNPIFATSGGDVFYGNFGNDADGSPLTASIQTTALDLGEPDLVKELTALRVGYIGSGLRVRVGWSNLANGTPTWQSYQEVPAGFEFLPVRIAGRYIFVEFQSQDAGDNWEIQALDFHGRVGGVR